MMMKMIGVVVYVFFYEKRCYGYFNQTFTIFYFAELEADVIAIAERDSLSNSLSDIFPIMFISRLFMFLLDILSITTNAFIPALSKTRRLMER